MEQDDRLGAVLAADPAAMSYEEARDGLLLIVQHLEEGQVPLEQTLVLWERGEVLARRCSEWLDDAQARIDAVMESQDSPPGENQAGASEESNG